MSGGALTVAFSAGALAAFNPCGFALLPSWAAVLVSGERPGDDLLGRLLRALKAAAVATLAFLAIFGVAGLAFSLGFAALGHYLPIAGLGIGLILAGLGALLLVDGHAPGLNVGRRASGGTDVRAVFSFGVAYALGSLSCVLPVFLLTLGIAAGQPLATRVGGFVGFALGMGTVLALVAVAAAVTGEGAQRVRTLLRIVPRLAGAVVLGAAVVVLARQLGLAAVSLGHHEPALTIRTVIALAATTIVAAAALASAHGRGRALVRKLRRRRARAFVPPLRPEEMILSHDCCPPAGASAATGDGSARAETDGPLVEVLYFDGCPNDHASVALVERVASELGIRPQIRLVNVPDAETAAQLRFLGSPTVRVGGRDIEPGADERTEFVLSCRVFRTDTGFSGEPDEQWVRNALLREAAVSV